jgi:hypothetical protein
MFINELELFSSDIINLPLEVVSVVVVNIVQIERITKILNYAIKPTPNHKGSVEITITKELKVKFENKVYPKINSIKYRSMKH